MSSRSVFVGATLLALIAADPLEAAIYTDTLAEFSHTSVAPYPGPEQVVGTFSFTIGAGETILSAFVDGTFGNSIVPNSAGFDLYGDGQLLGQCIQFTACYSSQTVTPFSFAVLDLSTLLDGELILSVIQTSEFTIRLGETTLTVETAAVPVMATLPLLGTGIAAMGLMGWVRRRRSATTHA